MVVVPYVHGLTEKVCRVFKKRKWSIAVKPHLTCRNILVPMSLIDCKNCVQKYIMETTRKLPVRVKEYKYEM